MFKTLKIVIVFALIFCISLSAYATERFSSDAIFDSDVFANNGPLNVPYTDLVVTGDSYGGRFCIYEEDKDFNIIPQIAAGKTIVENEDIMKHAMTFDSTKFVLICIGVNDHLHSTMPYYFEATLRRILNAGVDNNCYIFITSFVDYPYASSINRKFSTIYYDNIIKRLAQEYTNTYYIDTHDCACEKYADHDLIHYNKDYYELLYGRFIEVLRTIAF